MSGVFAAAALGFCGVGDVSAAELGKASLVVEGVVNPESAVVGADGRTYVSCIGERDKDGDGIVAVVVDGKPVPFATGFDDPKGITAIRERLFVTDRTRVWAIDRDGKATVFAAKESFPVEPLFLNDIAADEGGTLYVSDSGLKEGGKGKVFAISSDGKSTLVVDETKIAGLKRPNGVLIGRDKKLLLADVLSGILYRIKFPSGEVETVAEGLGGPDGIVEDGAGNLFIGDVRGGKVFRILPGNSKPVLIAEGFTSAADITLALDGKSLLVPDTKAGKVFRQPIGPETVVVPTVRDLKNPESAAWSAADNTLYVTVIGEFDKDGDGLVMAYPPGKPGKVFAQGLNDPKGIVIYKDELYVTDKTRIVKIDKAGVVSVALEEKEFDPKPTFLNDITFDEEGSFVVSDSGDEKGKGAAVYGVILEAGFLKGAAPIFDPTISPLVKRPNGVLFDTKGKVLWVVDFETGDLLRAAMNVEAPKLEKIASGFPGGDGLVLDAEGNLYISSWKTGELWVLPKDAKEARLISNQFVSAADICLDVKNGRIIVPDMKAGTITGIPLPTKCTAESVDSTPAAVRIENAFPELTLERPIALTNAGDGTNRLFVIGQRGKVFVFPNEKSVSEPTVFLDLVAQTAPFEKAAEEGLLGLAFHPKYKTNGEFFVFYTPLEQPRRSRISRFKVDPKNPNAADPKSEEVVIEIAQPFANHNGGTIVFGPDGMLYIGMGDGGGAGGDPLVNGQNLGTHLSKILRIDVDHKHAGLAYAVPKDNPFVGREGAKPEIWTYGMRNPWRMAFDPATGDFWAADVGQGVWEEINLITRGGNYGWSLVEGLHPFKPVAEPKDPLVAPIWEYHHELGKSITGGSVYRGKLVPELVGHYLYADYVSGRVWALKYDRDTKKVVANRPIFGNVAPITSFGEDENGEVYFVTINGGIFKFASSK
ncbi:MAG: PQQ-dependent sugar dehydrogenase [Planctomycetia bacterium]|nr:PQQ-dependent sugar dehydrogenase [Planctomycetia bacterium]